MKRTICVVLIVVPLSIIGYVEASKAIQAAKQKRLTGRVQALQEEVAGLLEAKRFAQTADKLEELQVLLMDNGRYQDALAASLQIEEVSHRFSDRLSPWNYVRVGEAYLGMGDTDRYFEWMNKAVNERYFSKTDYFQDARFNPLRAHPEFKKLVEACATTIGVGRPAKDFEITLLDGSPFSLSAQKGKVVLIDFWDVRCGPCRKEMPNLKEIHRDFRARGLEIVGISLDTEKKLLDDYLKEASLPWKIACSYDGWSDSTARLYRISATPSTWLIDRRGIVRYYDVRGAELRRAVEELTRQMS